MKTVYKYELTGDECVLNLPKYAEILDTKTINNITYIWALVDTEEPLELSLKFHKFKIPVNDEETTLHLPRYANIHHIFGINEIIDTIFLWTLTLHFKEDAPKYPHKFKVYGTGHPCKYAYYEYRGTITVADGKLVWHLFETNTRIPDPMVD